MNIHPIPLTKTEMMVGFVMKAFMGILYGWIFLHQYHGDDTWMLQEQSLRQTQLLLHHPGQFFSEYLPFYILDPANGEKHRYFLFLFNLEYALLVKTLAIFNLGSRGNYYINSVLFNAIVFWGHYWLFNLLNGLFPGRRNLFYAAVFFLAPSLFWLSGIRADGLLFFFSSLFLLHFFLPKNRMAPLYGLAGFGGIFILRPEFALLLAVALTVYRICRRIKNHRAAAFAMVYIIYGVIFLGMLWLGAGKIGSLIAERQHAFLALKGTAFPLNRLHSSAGSFLGVIPQAVSHSFWRPFLWEARTPLQFLYALEVLCLWGLFLVSIVYRSSNWKDRLSHPVILTLLFFSLSAYLFIGMVVPFPGAMVRYKAIPELFLVCILVSLIDHKKILNFF